MIIQKVLLAACGCMVLAAAAAPTLHIAPGPVVLDGEPVHVAITGAVPRSEVRLVAQRWFAPLAVQQARPRLMRSEAVFLADAAGRVDLRTSPALRGTYQGVDERGMFWSMHAVVGVERAAPGSVDTDVVRFELHADGGQVTASVRLQRALPEVMTMPADPLPGAVFATLPGTRKRPALIILGGSEGGTVVTLDAAPFASHGFAVLALPLFSPPDPRTGAREVPALPAQWADLPVETLNRARDWLAARPEVDASRIAVHGTSMGAVLALLGGVHLRWPAAIVASVPSDIVWEGWGPGVEDGTRSTFAVGGVPLQFVPLVGYAAEMQGYERKQPVIVRRPHERGRQVHADRVAQARIPVERITVPVMVIGADDDQMWPSGEMARNIVASRQSAGLHTEALLYRDAGHLLYATGYAPTTTYNAGLRKTGGTAEGTARAQAEVWPRTIRFLQRVLGD